MQEFAIFDFDGTLTNLNVDWQQLRTEFSVERFSDLWKLEMSLMTTAFELITKSEVNGTGIELNFHRNLFEGISKFSVITNNSEKAVSRFFNNLNSDTNWPQLNPRIIVGRETLEGPKEIEGIFRNGIVTIFESMKIETYSDCLYIGDKDYELEYAGKLGLKAIHISEFR